MNDSQPKKIISTFIVSHDYFPGNARFPLLIYKNAYSLHDSVEHTQSWLEKNTWSSSWVDSIYDFHHYHSKTHEVLAIIAGVCLVQFGGAIGPIYAVNPGDVVIIPAGVAHKSIEKSHDFQCIGAYPVDIGEDMHLGTKAEYANAIESIQQVGLPEKDPVFGSDGLMFEYWK